MKISKKFTRYTAPVLFAAFAFSAGNAAAQFRNLPLNVAVNTAEILTPANIPGGVVCPMDQFYYGGVTISTTPGTMTISLPSGNYTRLVTVVATDCATPSFSFSQGRMKIYAVNGAGSLSADYGGSFAPAPSPTGQTILSINSASFTITGGTGIFDSASGTGQLSGTVNATNPLLPMPGSLQAAGTISFSKPAFERGHTSY